MKHNINKIIGYAIGATDGEIGKVTDFYFDDKSWTIRYLIVETGSWLAGRKVLISPEALINREWSDDSLPVNLTTEQVKSSPDIDTEKPVSVQQEMELLKHYAWTDSYRAGAGGLRAGDVWSGGIGTTGMVLDTFRPVNETLFDQNDAEPATPEGDPNLQSANATKGYNIQAKDGEIGDVEDYIFDDSNWKIEYLVVDTGRWLPGKKVLVSPRWIKEVSWENSSVVVDLTIESVKNSPEFDSIENLTAEYTTGLHNHYGYSS